MCIDHRKNAQSNEAVSVFYLPIFGAVVAEEMRLLMGVVTNKRELRAIAYRLMLALALILTVAWLITGLPVLEPLVLLLQLVGTWLQGER